LEFQTKTKFKPNRTTQTKLDGPHSQALAKNYVGQASPNANTNSHFMSFTGTAQDQKIEVKKSGVVALCYCAILDVPNENMCSASQNFLFAGLIMIAGPLGNQKW
jgi:hypothetical protein